MTKEQYHKLTNKEKYNYCMAIAEKYRDGSAKQRIIEQAQKYLEDEKK